MSELNGFHEQCPPPRRLLAVVETSGLWEAPGPALLLRNAMPFLSRLGVSVRPLTDDDADLDLLSAWCDEHSQEGEQQS
jgi:hypothetical protein